MDMVTPLAAKNIGIVLPEHLQNGVPTPAMRQDIMARVAYHFEQVNCDAHDIISAFCCPEGSDSESNNGYSTNMLVDTYTGYLNNISAMVFQRTSNPQTPGHINFDGAGIPSVSGDLSQNPHPSAVTVHSLVIISRSLYSRPLHH
ncbi:hypothetical protein BJ165DRAFT_1527717 [Panaeolus papilionaceus]|nr:hypothetical protein BJ165DRAFT_1527717 [Panaeolus papilionaceus]